MKQILILESNPKAIVDELHKQNLKSGADYFEDVLSGFDPSLKFVKQAPYDAEFDANILHDVDGVVLTGSMVSWGVDDLNARPLQNTAHAAFNSGLPIWGSNNGLQMAAFLLGGENCLCTNGPEIGLAKDIRLTDAGQSHPMMKGRAANYSAPIAHQREIISPPENGIVLAENAHSPVQAMAQEAGGVLFWGTQYNPEISAAQMLQLLSAEESNHDLDEAAISCLKEVEGDGEMETSKRAIELKNWLDNFFS